MLVRFLLFKNTALHPLFNLKLRIRRHYFTNIVIGKIITYFNNADRKRSQSTLAIAPNFFWFKLNFFSYSGSRKARKINPKEVAINPANQT